MLIGFLRINSLAAGDIAMNDSKIIVALDDIQWDEALSLAESLAGNVWGFKLNDLLDGDGASAAWMTKRLSEFGKVFIDIKTHDTAQTAGNRVKKHAQNGAHLVTAHASGGIPMLEAAVKAFEDHKQPDALGILAVGVLTSFDDDTCKQIYLSDTETTQKRFAGFASEAGTYGMIASPLDVPILKALHPDMRFVTPGVRPAGSSADGQVRFDTPGAAIKAGSSLLVIGSPILKAKDRFSTVEAINVEVRENA